MVELTTRDADGVNRRVRISIGGLDLSARERKLIRNARFPDALRHILTAGSLLLFVAFIAAITSTATGLRLASVAAAVLFAMGMLSLITGGVWMVCRWIDFKEADVVARGWLRVGRCPACGYRIDASLPDNDGAVPCAECGARWMLSGV